ncbi:hypothetical protein HZB94_01135 [Candidatus Falkowbacteria bacterium]|nr:hypothetical protein [Candidatus Falkowbacteria bacterium]
MKQKENAGTGEGARRREDQGLQLTKPKKNKGKFPRQGGNAPGKLAPRRNSSAKKAQTQYFSHMNYKWPVHFFKYGLRLLAGHKAVKLYGYKL